MTSIADLSALALQCHQAGDFGRAEQLYRQILQADPHHADAHHLLGVLAYQAGRYDLAVASIRQALALTPWAPAYYSNLGLAQDAQGQTDDAINSYRHALRIQLDCVEAHNNLAIALQKRGRIEESIIHAQQALRFRPGFAEAHNCLGNALQIQGKFGEAADQFRLALSFRPNFPEVHNNLGNALHHLGDMSQAAAHYREALRLNPHFAQAYCNLGNSLRHQFQLEEAIHCYEHALRLRPAYLEAWNNLGNALLDQGRVTEGVDCYRRALQVNPDSAQARCNLGNALQAQGLLDDAVECYQQALRVKPDLPEANNNLGRAFLGQGRSELAAERFQQTLRARPNLDAAQSNLLLCQNYDPDIDLDALFADHCRWGQERIPTIPVEPHANDRNPDRRLRIGYLSPDFLRHALTRYMEPVIAHHDPQQVETYCYAELSRPDDVTARLQAIVHGWRLTRGLTDLQVAQQIRSDGIDILVDLAGHTADNRLGVFALKPAPIQITWLGYLNTTGLPTVDYRFTDEVLDPLNGPRRDVEELYRLPGGFCCFGPPQDAPSIGPLPGLRSGNLTFGSPHNLFKLNPKVYDLWSQVLSALPSARLMMFRESLTGSAADTVKKRFADRGIDPQRLDLRQTKSDHSYLKLYEEIDIGLDTWPWSGGVTTCESLWMGVPVLSLCGNRAASRNSAAVLTHVGLKEWAVATPDEFVKAATHWAGQLEKLAEVRSRLREQMTTTICDAARFTRGLEDAYRTMWRRWCTAAGGTLGGTP